MLSAKSAGCDGADPFGLLTTSEAFSGSEVTGYDRGEGVMIRLLASAPVVATALRGALPGAVLGR